MTEVIGIPLDYILLTVVVGIKIYLEFLEQKIERIRKEDTLTHYVPVNVFHVGGE